MVVITLDNNQRLYYDKTIEADSGSVYVEGSKMKRFVKAFYSELLNLFGILAALVGMMALSGASLSASASLYRLLLAGLLFLASWQLLAAGLSAPMRRPVRRRSRRTAHLTDGSPATHRAA